MIRAVIVLACFVLSCQLPTEPTDACRDEATFCADKQLAPLSPVETAAAIREANDWLDSIGTPGPHVTPYVQWRPCFFAVGGICAAGWTESVNRIHVSTAQPERTAALVKHEVTHARYGKAYGDFDAGHTRQYRW